MADRKIKSVNLQSVRVENKYTERFEFEKVVQVKPTFVSACEPEEMKQIADKSITDGGIFKSLFSPSLVFTKHM